MKSNRLILALVLLLAAGLAVGLAVALAAPGPITFGPRVDYALGGGSAPDPLGVGYFNADSYPDITVPLRNLDAVRVLLGDGTGAFSNGALIAVQDQPNGVFAGDFNEDGISDMAIPYYNGWLVGILIGDGSGGFSAEQTLSVGGPFMLALGDLNGDGHVDIAAPGAGLNNLSVLLGDGVGGFSHGTTVTIGASMPNGAAIGDLDGDADNDIAVSNVGARSVSILINNGAGVFSLGTTLTVGDNPYGPGLGDFDGDSDADLAVPNAVDDNLSIRLGNGDGTFSNGTTLTVGDFPYQPPAVEDIDGDGIPDLAVGGNSNISILRGDGAGGFSYEATLTVPLGSAMPVAHDLNGDSRPDLAVSRLAGDDASVFLSTTLFPSSLDLAASRTLVSYGGTTMLQGSLMSDWRIIVGRTDVQVWRKSSFDPVFKRDGTAAYDPTTGQYDALRALTSNTRFKMRFGGDSIYKSVTSAEVLVQSRASLTQPTLLPTSPRRNTNFNTSGALRPRHVAANSTKLYFYRKVLGRWRHYKWVAAGLTNFPTYTRYSATTKLPYAGAWYVKAYHADASHAATWSSPRYFTVR